MMGPEGEGLPESNAVSLPHPERGIRRPSSEFERAVGIYDNLRFIEDRTTEQNTQFKEARKIVEDLIAEADAAGILSDVRDYHLPKLYRDVRKQPPGLRLAALRVHPDQDMEGSFWRKTSKRSLVVRFLGARQFLLDEVQASFEKDLGEEGNLRDKDRVGDDEYEIGDNEYVKIKHQSELDRPKAEKFGKTPYGRFEFDWAENVDELVPTVMEWLDSVEADTPNEDVEKVAAHIDQIRNLGLDALSDVRNRLNRDFNTSISEKDPTYTRLKNLIEARLNVFGGDRVVNRGGWMYFINYWKNFANNFVEHLDALMFEGEMIPMAHHLLSKDDGVYWRGAWDIPGKERPTDGEVEAFQNARGEEMAEFLSKNELTIKGMLEVDTKDLSRDKFRLQDEYDKELRWRFFKVRDRFLRANKTFQSIRHRLDRSDAENNPELRDLVDAKGNLLPWEQRQQFIKQLVLSKIQQTDQAFLDKLTSDFTQKGEKEQEAVLKDPKSKPSNTLAGQQRAFEISLFKLLGSDAKDKWNSYQRDPGAFLSTASQEDRRLVEDIEDQQNINTNYLLLHWVDGVYNKGRPEKWSPSSWDRVKLKIDRPELVLARALTKAQLEDMYSPLSELRSDLADKPEQMNKLISERVDEAKAAITQAKRTQVFFGVASRNGGTRIRYTDAQGNVTRIRPLWAEFRDRANVAIDADASNPPEQQAFRVTHIFRKLGMADKMPTWSSYIVNDDSSLEAFSRIIGIPVDDKPKMVEIIENERRNMQKIWDDLAQEFMVGKVKEGWRKRVNHKGGNIDIRKVFFNRYMVSTSGGVLSPEMVPYMDLQVFDLPMEMGAQDFREFVGWVKRRDEVEQQYQPFWNVLDPIDWWKRLHAAEDARKIIAGGALSGGESVDGFLNSPLSGSFEMRDFLTDKSGGGMGHTKKTPGYLRKLYEFRVAVGKGELSADQIRKRQDEIAVLRKETGPDFDLLEADVKDGMIKVADSVLKNLKVLFKSRSYIENRMPRAAKTLRYENTKLWYVFRDWLRYSKEFDEVFDFSEEARSEIAVRAYELFLMDEHMILDKEEREKFFPGQEAKTQNP